MEYLKGGGFLEEKELHGEKEPRGEKELQGEELWGESFERRALCENRRLFGL